MPAAAAIQSLSDLQGAFAHALLAAEAPVPQAVTAPQQPAIASRFGVYRNNVIVGLINALAARYPAARRLLWDDTFNVIAHLYAVSSPPRSPVLLEYGEEFPDFIRNFGDSTARDYVADVAEIESARVRAYHAADATPVDRQAFASLAPTELAGMRLTLHPSVTLLRSRFPVFSVWESQQAGNDAYIREWRPESVLIARPYMDVEVHRLPTGGYEFLSALSEGDTVAVSIDRAMTATPAFDLGVNLTTVIGSSIVVGMGCML
jgi:hypothetical protein